MSVTYLESLNEQQREAVLHEGSPLLILAGAGSGKTRVITTKIAYLIGQKNVDPWNILAVTFTKKAANEMRERTIQLESRAGEGDVMIKTFHSFGAYFLRRYGEKTGLKDSFTVYDDDDSVSLLKMAVPSLSSKEARSVFKQIALAKDYCLLPEDDLSILKSDYDLNFLYSAYQKQLRATGNADFGDLITLPYLVMKQNPDVAERIHRRFKTIMVDEYQDTNIAQYRLLQELSGIQQGNDCNVCVVGDDDQSIYKFRGAEVKNILSFPEVFPNTKIVKLEQNYRSTAQILNAANLIVKKNLNRLDKTLFSNRNKGSKPSLVFLGDQNEEQSFVSNLIYEAYEKGFPYSSWAVLYRTNAQSTGFEKEFIRRKIPYKIFGSVKLYERAEIKDIIAYLSLLANHSDVIAFKRIVNKPARSLGSKAQEQILQAALITENQKFSTEDLSEGTDGRKSENDENSLNKTSGADGKEILYEDLLEVLKKQCQDDLLSKKALEGAKSFIALYESLSEELQDFPLKSPNSQRDTFALEREKNLSEKEKKSNKKLSSLLKLIVEKTALADYYKTGDQVEDSQLEEYLQGFIDSAASYDCTLEKLTEFLESINLERTLASQSLESSDFVTLITLHNTKGLEFDNVIITGLEEGVFPRFGKSGEELEEERRLFYVGITRSKNQLYVTSTARRALYGRWEYMQPSQFLYDAASAFDILGSAPFGFKSSSNLSCPYEEDNSALDDELVQKWKKGTKIFHDDYGEGYIVKSGYNGSEFVIHVQFFGGNVKRFLPKYQASKLTIIKD